MTIQNKEDRCGYSNTSEYQAKLIASTPEALEVCRALVNILHVRSVVCSFGTKFTPRGNECECTEHAAYDKARAALREAGVYVPWRDPEIDPA